MKKYFYILLLICFVIPFFLVSCGGGGGGTSVVSIPSNDTGTLQGSLFDELGEGVSSAVIKLEPGGYSVNTDEYGAFSLTIPVNTYKLTVVSNGETFSFTENIDILKDTTKILRLSFSPLEGYIINHPLLGRTYLRSLSSINPEAFGYSPLSGAGITLTGAPGSLTTDGAGYFRYERALAGLQNLEVDYNEKKIKEIIPVSSKTDSSEAVELKAPSDSITLLEGSVYQLSAYGLSSNGDIIIPPDINWSVSDSSVGSVNPDGVFIAKSSGRTEIYAESRGNTVIIIIIVTTGVGNISGRVTEEGTGEALSNLEVGVAGVNTIDITDINGEYFLENIPANLEVIVTVSRDDYLLGSKPIVVLPDDTVIADISVNSYGPYLTPLPTVSPAITPTVAPGASPTFIPVEGDFILLPGGTYQMGDSTGIGPAVELPVHDVTLSSFYVGKYEVTCIEYCRFLNSLGNREEPAGTTWTVTGGWIYGGPNTGTFAVRSGSENKPVILVTWYGAVAYCNWLSEIQGLDKCYGEWSSDGSERWGANGENFYPENNGYRLPTEAEWEYACRSGYSTDYFWGENYPPSNADIYCCYGNPDWDTWEIATVGTFLPNDFGIFDMSGNVLEWCNDYYSGGGFNENFDSENTWYYNHSTAGGPDPTGPPITTLPGESRVLRGGHYTLPIVGCRSATRYNAHSTAQYDNTGFRVVKRAE